MGDTDGDDVDARHQDHSLQELCNGFAEATEKKEYLYKMRVIKQEAERSLLKYPKAEHLAQNAFNFKAPAAPNALHGKDGSEVRDKIDNTIY